MKGGVVVLVHIRKRAYRLREKKEYKCCAMKQNRNTRSEVICTQTEADVFPETF